MQTDKKPFYKRHVRLLSCLLAIILLLGTLLTVLGATSRVTINTDGNLSNPAENILAGGTDYVNKNTTERMLEIISQFASRPKGIEDYYNLAGTQIAREQYSEAISNIDKCLALYDEEVLEDPELVFFIDLWLKKACLHVMLEEYEEALAALGVILEADDSVSDAYLVSAQIYAVLGDIPKMSESLTKYLELVPEDTEMKELLAQALLQQAEYEDLKDYADSSTSGKPKTVELEFLDGLYALQDENYSLAEAALTRAIKLDANYEGLYYFRGICRLSLGNYSGATSDFEQSIARDYMVHSATYNLGIARILSDDYENGVSAVESAAQMDADSSIKAQAEEFLKQIEELEAESVVMEYLIKAQAASEQGDYAALATHLTDYLALAPEDIGIRELLAQTLFATETYTAAAEQYRILISDLEATIDNLDALKNTAGPDAPQSEIPEEAQKLADYYYLLGLAHIQLSDFANAEAALSNTIAFYGSYDAVYYYRGVCNLSLENYTAAIEDFNFSIFSGIMTHSCTYNRGICKFMLEDYESGVEDITAAAEMDEDPEVKAQAQALLDELYSQN